MLRPNHKQTNFYSSLYNRIPENHLLKRIEKAVDFSFINKLLADSYCATFGRPAKEPELMVHGTLGTVPNVPKRETTRKLK